MSLGSSFWDNRPTLVTGATGLLGGWLVKRLLNLGADVLFEVITLILGIPALVSDRWLLFIAVIFGLIAVIK